MKCSNYVIEDHEWWERRTPCKCPICGGFLKWEKDWRTGDTQPKCNKCKTELIMLPVIEDGMELNWGKICPISLPQSSLFKENKDK